MQRHASNECNFNIMTIAAKSLKSDKVLMHCY
jgi:hypothetical protein